MASAALVRTSARRGSRCFVSATPSGGEVSFAVRRLSTSTTRADQLPTDANKKVSIQWHKLLQTSYTHFYKQLDAVLEELHAKRLDALLEELRAKKATLLPNDVVSYIFVSSMHARKDFYAKQLSRSSMTGSVLVSGGFCGYYMYKQNNVGDGAPEGNS